MMQATVDTGRLTTTHLSDQDLAYFKALILEKQDEAYEELEQLQQSLANMMESDEADSSSTAHHMADVATDEETIQMYYRLISRTESYIRQLDRALARIKNRTYGICRASGKPIPWQRLEAVPHTRYGIEAKLQGLEIGRASSR